MPLEFKLTGNETAEEKKLVEVMRVLLLAGDCFVAETLPDKTKQTIKKIIKSDSWEKIYSIMRDSIKKYVAEQNSLEDADKDVNGLMQVSNFKKMVASYNREILDEVKKEAKNVDEEFEKINFTKKTNLNVKKTNLNVKKTTLNVKNKNVEENNFDEDAFLSVLNMID